MLALVVVSINRHMKFEASLILKIRLGPKNLTMRYVTLIFSCFRYTIKASQNLNGHVT